jgi:hypothetical protein
MDIIKELNLRSGADVDDDVWVMYINSAIRVYGRYIGRLERLGIPFVENGVLDYNENGKRVNGESIKSVWIDGVQLQPIRFDEPEREGTYCIEPGDKVRINAGEWEQGELWHYSVIPAKTRDDIKDFDNQDMNVDDEYINAVIYGALAEYNEVNEEIEAANNYRNKADEIVARAMQGRYSKNGKYPVTKDVMRWN